MDKQDYLKRKAHILGVIEDLVGDLLYYDRKEDEELRRGEIEKAIQEGVVTVDEMVHQFRYYLEEALELT
jgi:hypothetical protein